MNHTLAIAIIASMLALFCGCKDSVPPKFIRHQGFTYVRLDVVQHEFAESGIAFYLKPKTKESK